jgi:hypothetical protein
MPLTNVFCDDSDDKFLEVYQQIHNIRAKGDAIRHIMLEKKKEMIERGVVEIDNKTQES